MIIPGSDHWKRVEGSTVSADLEEGLQARIADPLWFLTRQWQSGEFRGEDTGSPVLVTAELERSTIDQYRPVTDGQPQHWKRIDSLGQPLEVVVEREHVGLGPTEPRQRIDAGLFFLRLLDEKGAEDQKQAFRDFEVFPEFEVQAPANDGRHEDGQRLLELLAPRAIDGWALYDKLVVRSGPTDWSGLPTIPPHLQGAVNSAFEAFVAWFGDRVREPDSDVPRAWNPRRMEHRFQVSAPTDTGALVLEATEYPGGNLDWYAFDVAPPPEPGDPQPEPPDSGFNEPPRTHTTLPTPLRYPGMPVNRFWEIEDAAVWWGGIQGGPEDLARYLVASFASVYSDDWYVVPFTVKAGSLCAIRGVTVLDTFGESHTIEPLSAVDAGTTGWRFFELGNDPRTAAGQSPYLFVAPALSGRLEGPAIDQIDLLRDEGANLAWAVERFVVHASGKPVDRRALWEKRAEPAPSSDGQTWMYRLSTTVPDYWVPLMPARFEGSDPLGAPTVEVGLVRAQMPVSGLDGTIELLGATSPLLEPHSSLFIHEEEIPGGGATVQRRYQLARDAQGRLHLWLGREKKPGRGAGQSGLVFDTIDRGPKKSRMTL